MPGRNKLFLDGNAGLNSNVCMTVNLDDKKFRQSCDTCRTAICLSLWSQNTQTIDHLVGFFFFQFSSK